MSKKSIVYAVKSSISGTIERSIQQAVERREDLNMEIDHVIMEFPENYGEEWSYQWRAEELLKIDEEIKIWTGILEKL